jgi:membrane protease YdiL (CAAX protease family)
LPAPESIPASAWVIYALIVGIAAAVYARVARHLARHGGRVRTADFGLPELLMSVVLASMFAMLMIGTIQRQVKGAGEVTIETILPGSLIFIILSVGILAFLHFSRRLPIALTFGLNQVKPLAALGWAGGLLLAAFPLTGVANVLTLSLLKDGFKPQPLIELFSDVAQQGDHLAVAKIFIAGVIVAPCCEEFLFRGFFYGVWKRYLGPLWAGLLACALFAAFHTSLPALAGLFVLAVCLNVAYERTGSLLVPIGMHALFNFTSLLVLYVQARFAVLPASL